VLSGAAPQIGPLPNSMCEHAGLAERIVTLVAQWAAMVTALVLAFLGWPRGCRRVVEPRSIDLDEPSGKSIATCSACPADEPVLGQVRSLRGLAR
jgi:hypothetical protein